MENIRILGISSSLNSTDATSQLINYALEGASKIKGTETKFITLGKKEVKPCINCKYCPTVENKNYCIIKDDMEEIYKSILWANGMIWGSPVHNQTLNSKMKIMMERCKPFERLGLFNFKVGAGIAVGSDRNYGQEYAIHAVQSFFISNMMLVVGGIHGAVGISGVASQEGMINNDMVFQETYGRKITAKENAILLGKFVATWVKIFYKGSLIFNPKIQLNLQ